MDHKGGNNWQEQIQPADSRACDNALSDLIPSPVPPAQCLSHSAFPCWAMSSGFQIYAMEMGHK